MRCYLCGEEITRDMTDINGRVLEIPIPGKILYNPAYICEDCVQDSYTDWDTIHDMETAPDY